jgi:hypothetical protein
MNRLKSILIIYVMPALAVCAVVFGGDYVSNSSMQLCTHQYALCTSALCVPQPDDPNKAICFCDVENGSSTSTAPCKTLQPSTDANGIRTVYSTFSFKQFKEGKKGMKCPEGTPWTWCLNKRCTVDPANAKKAICVCDVMRTDQWTTLGGQCDTSTCETGYWSGATLNDLQEANMFLTKAMRLDASPIKWCPEVSP